MEIKTTESFKEVLASKNEKDVTVAVFTMDKCVPCKLVKDAIKDKLQKAYSSVEFLIIDSQAIETADLTDEYSIRNAPTVICFKGDKDEARFVGAPAATKLAEYLAANA